MGSGADAVCIVLEGSMVVGGLARVKGIFESESISLVILLRAVLGLSEPGVRVGSDSEFGWTWLQ